MHLLRTAIGNANTTVGAVRSNTDRAIALTRCAAEGGAGLIALGEQLIPGYQPEDLSQWHAFVDAQWAQLERFARETEDVAAPVALGLTVARGPHLYNVAALVHRGSVLGLVPKEKLPTYDVFYEQRVYAQGCEGLFDSIHGGVPFGDMVFDFDFATIGLEVCEDGWSPDGPMRRRSYAGAEIIVNLSASPFRLGVLSTRREMLATRSHDNQCIVVYSSIVGGNDGLLFDGGGFVTQNGRVLLRAPRFREGVAFVTVDLERTRRMRRENTTWRNDQQTFATSARKVARVTIDEPTASPVNLTYPIPFARSFFLPEPPDVATPREAFCEEMLDALSLALGDYFEKTGAFETIGVALSGGRDSLLCLYLARRWIARRFPDDQKAKAKEVLRAFFMPSRYSSSATRAAAEQAARDFDAPFAVIPIDDAYERELREVERMLQPGETLGPMARQNIQARVRAARMWTWANAARGLFVQTSNMSEKSVGYTTIGGDMEGAFSVIANVPKTVVNYLLDYVYEKTGFAGIQLTLQKPASAELADEQEDEKELMPFVVLDACLVLTGGEKMSVGDVESVVRTMFPEYPEAQISTWVQRFSRLFSQSIFKWTQMPLSVHVGNLDLDRERALQLPVVQKTEW